MTCKDCIHEHNCLGHIRYGMGTDWNNQYTPDMEMRCKYFKNKANLVEVVRCKDCKWWENKDRCRNVNGLNHLVWNGDWFCASGQKKEGAEE